jgi:antirestriction protein ArdC
MLGQRVTRPLRHSGEPYRGVNILSLWMAATASGSTSPYWMTYRQALELGAQVRKGETASLVVYAGSMTKQDGETDDGAGGEVREFRYTKGYAVFNAMQIDGLPDHFSGPLAAPLNILARNDEAERFFATLKSDARHGGSNAYYMPDKDYIQLPPFESFVDAKSYYSTRAHETIHWTSHKTRLNRKIECGRYKEEAYAMEELVAELGAAFLCADLQLTPDLRPGHAAYIESWLEVFKYDNRAVSRAAAHAQRACDWLHALNGGDGG